MTTSESPQSPPRRRARRSPHLDPGLRDGWEPDTPSDDTLLLAALRAHADAYAVPSATSGARLLRTADFVLVDFGSPAGLDNAVTLLRPPADAEDLVAEVEQELTGGSGDVWLWTPWPIGDLRPRGWRLSGHPPLMLRPAGGVRPPTPDGLEIVRVRHADDLVEWDRVVVDGFPLTQLQPWRGASLLDAVALEDPRLRVYLGRVDGVAVTAASAWVDHGLVYLSLGVTLPRYRGRGLWRAMAWERISSQPTLPAVSVLSDMSRPPGEAIGFQPLMRWTAWVWPRS